MSHPNIFFRTRFLSLLSEAKIPVHHHHFLRPFMLESTHIWIGAVRIIVDRAFFIYTAEKGTG